MNILDLAIAIHRFTHRERSLSNPTGTQDNRQPHKNHSQHPGGAVKRRFCTLCAGKQLGLPSKPG